MQTQTEFTESIYRSHYLTAFNGILIMVLSVQIVLGTTYFMLLERTRIMVLVLVGLRALTHLLSGLVSRRLLRRWDLFLPTVLLWLQVFLVFVLTAALYLALLAGVPLFAGRGVWSGLLHVHPKSATILFYSTFMGFSLYWLILVVKESLSYLAWSVATIRIMGDNLTSSLESFAGKKNGVTSGDLEQEMGEMRDSLRAMEAHRLRAGSFNRWSLLDVFFVLALTAGYITFLRPELILYYRGELQLRTFQHPEAALEMFEHLLRKFPDYRYRDTVAFRAAWIRDRRLKQRDEARSAYRTFLDTYGYDNVWADEAVWSLIQLAMNPPPRPAVTLEWIDRFRTHFPDDYRLPQIDLFEARAQWRLGKKEEARRLLKAAEQKHRDAWIYLYNEEDDFIERIPFSVGVIALKAHFQKDP